MDFTRLDQQLRDSLVDLKLSNEERDELRQLGSDLGPDQVRYLRNRAFDLVRDLTLSDAANALPALKWLEQVIKTLDAASAPPRPAVASAHFSPGEDCLRKIRELCRQARETVDICVYTISDDRLSEEIVACHRRGVTVRSAPAWARGSRVPQECAGWNRSGQGWRRTWRSNRKRKAASLTVRFRTCSRSRELEPGQAIEAKKALDSHTD